MPYDQFTIDGVGTALGVGIKDRTDLLSINFPEYQIAFDRRQTSTQGGVNKVSILTAGRLRSGFFAHATAVASISTIKSGS